MDQESFPLSNVVRMRTSLVMADSKSEELPPHEVHEGSIQPSPTNVTDIAHGVDMDHYRATVPLWKRVWQHSLTQMMLLSVQAFCGPAMSDAITGETDRRSSEL